MYKILSIIIHDYYLKEFLKCYKFLYYSLKNRVRMCFKIQLTTGLYQRSKGKKHDKTRNSSKRKTRYTNIYTKLLKDYFSFYLKIQNLLKFLWENTKQQNLIVAEILYTHRRSAHRGQGGLAPPPPVFFMKA